MLAPLPSADVSLSCTTRARQSVAIYRSPASVARVRALGFASHVRGDDLTTLCAAVIDGLLKVRQLLGVAQVVD